MWILCFSYVNKNHNRIISTLFSDEYTLKPTSRMIDVLEYRTPFWSLSKTSQAAKMEGFVTIVSG